LHPAPDDKLTETAALIHDLAMQREEFRAEMDERPRLIVPGEDHGRAFRVVKTPGQDAILQPPKPRLLPRPRSSSSPQSATLNPRLEDDHC
jgi:hypothetical protein